MKIGVLETGPVLDALQPHYGTYGTMFEAMLRPEAPDFIFAHYPVYENDIPAADQADGWILSGSRYGAYEDLPWIPPLEALIRDAVSEGRPVAGFCFGHQIMAQALGGKVVKSDKGWGLGTAQYALSEDRPAFMADAGDGFATLAVHQDQVVEVPPGAHVLASSEFCPIAALSYGDPDHPTALSVQPHPEFSPEFVEGLLDNRLSEIIPAHIVDQARASLGQPLDNAAWARWVVKFFRGAAGARSPHS